MSLIELNRLVLSLTNFDWFCNFYFYKFSKSYLDTYLISNIRPSFKTHTIFIQYRYKRSSFYVTYRISSQLCWQLFPWLIQTNVKNFKFSSYFYEVAYIWHNNVNYKKMFNIKSLKYTIYCNTLQYFIIKLYCRSNKLITYNKYNI